MPTVLDREPAADDVTRRALAAGNGDNHAMALFIRATQTDVWRLCSYLGDHRAAFVLTQILGVSYAEAAEVCGIPIGTIRSRVARAREDLVTAVEADGVIYERAQTISARHRPHGRRTANNA